MKADFERQMAAENRKEDILLEKDAALRDTITTALTEIGVPAHLKGFRQLRYAIFVAVKYPDMIYSVTKCLYPATAKEFQTTPSRVERNIRHAIETAFIRCEWDTLYQWFGNTIAADKGKPTNAEFIAAASEKCRGKKV